MSLEELKEFKEFLLGWGFYLRNFKEGKKFCLGWGLKIGKNLKERIPDF